MANNESMSVLVADQECAKSTTTTTTTTITTEKKERTTTNHQMQMHLKPLPEDAASDCSNRRGFCSSNQSSKSVCQSSQSSFNLEEASKQSNQFRTTKKNLLQRRNSNTSLALALNIQHSSSSLNRFNSHNSLNCLHQTAVHADRNARKGMLDLNYSMMCSLSTNGINNKTEKPEAVGCTDYHRKFLSSENLHNLFKHSCKFNPSERPAVFDFSKNSIGLDAAESLEDEEDDCACHRITIKTKPLSPQSTSEDFKIHLANLHYLQNATNPLSTEYLSNLGCAFHINNGNTNKVSNKSTSSLFASLDHYKVGDDKKATTTTATTAATSQNRKLDNFFNYKLKSTPPFETMNASEQDKKKCLVKLHQEFWEIPTNFQEKLSVFGHSHKNRYKSILPNETTRVVLQPDSTVEPYINANFIKGPDYRTNCFIATQGPMPSTIYEFWLMVCQENQRKTITASTPNYSKIAMLTNFMENQCSVYFPVDKNQLLAFTNSKNCQEDNELVVENSSKVYNELAEGSFAPDFNYFLIKNVDVCQRNGYSVRKLNVVYRQCGSLYNKYEFHVIHYWFLDWPDHRSPEHVDCLLDMSLDLLGLLDASTFVATSSSQTIESTSQHKTMTSNTLTAQEEKVETYNNTTITHQTATTSTLTYREDKQVFSRNKSKSLTNADIVELLASKPLPIVHCSAGIGRTGAAIAIMNGIGQMRYKFCKADSDSVKVDILRIVCNLRLSRGGMVQNSEQYELIHKTLCIYQERLFCNASHSSE